jgi:hypothetical protein
MLESNQYQKLTTNYKIIQKLKKKEKKLLKLKNAIVDENGFTSEEMEKYAVFFLTHIFDLMLNNHLGMLNKKLLTSSVTKVLNVIDDSNGSKLMAKSDYVPIYLMVPRSDSLKHTPCRVTSDYIEEL